MTNVETLGPLRARIVESARPDAPVVVLAHGFGAPGTDLVGLHQVLPDHCHYVFPEAPHSLEALGMPDGRAWWMIDMYQFQMAMAQGKFRDLKTEVPEGLAPARAMYADFLEQVRARFASGPERMILGGFSQGAMLSTDALLHQERTYAGLILWSGTYLAESVWTPKFADHHQTPVLQSHGRHDPVLPYALAEELNAALRSAAWNVDFVEFIGQHEIPMPAIDRTRAFISARLPPGTEA